MSSRVTLIDRRIAENIKAVRLAGRVSMARIARHLKISYQSYQALERGETSFRVSTLHEIAKFYGMAIEHLIGPIHD